MGKIAGKAKGLSKGELDAMKEHLKEINAGKANNESAVLVAIAKMPEPDRSMGRRIHAVIKASAPSLAPRTWYGMPAYSNKDGKVVCFFRGGYKFKERYAVIGFQDPANLDNGNMWPVVFAIAKLTSAEEAKIAELVKRAVG